MKKDKVKLSEKLGFLTFSTATNTIFNLKSIYYWTFLKMILNIPPIWATVIVTIGTIWDAINDPLIGFYSVNHKFKNGEKVRPYALLFAIPWAITIVLMFTNFKLNQTWTIIACIVIYILFEAFYTFLCIPYNSMAALSTNDDDQRRSINSFRSLGGCLGSGIGAVAVPILVKNVFHGLQSDIYTPSDGDALFKTALIMAAVCIIGCLTHFFTAKERIKQTSDNEEHISFKETFKMLYSIKSWVFNMLFILCYGILNAIVMNEVNDYAAYILNDSTLATPIMAVYLVVAVVVSLTIGFIDRKIGHKKLMILAGVILIVGRIPFMIFPRSIVTVCILAFSTGIGQTIAFIMFNTNRNNVSDIVEFKFNRRIDSMVSTCDNLISKLAEAIAVWVVGLALSLAGYNAELGINQPLSAQSTIIALLGWVTALVALAMIIFASKADVNQEYQIEKKKAQNK